MTDVENKKFPHVRGAPPGAMCRLEFAARCGVHRHTVEKAEKAGRIKARFVFGRGRGRNPTYTKPYYLPEDIESFRNVRYWRSGKAMRAARQMLKAAK